MDVIEPDLIWVEGRCYRFRDKSVWSDKQIAGPYYEDYDQEEGMDAEAEEVADINIETTKDNKFKHTFHVPKLFYGYLIGFKGNVKKSIESDTRTTIKIPRVGEKKEDIEIIGSKRADVITCRRRIDLVIESSKKKAAYTHFLAIPLNNEEIIKNFDEFRKSILTNEMLPEDMKDLFVSPYKLHLTIGMLKLFDDDDKSNTLDALNECLVEVIRPTIEKKTYDIEIKGLEIMNDDMTNIKVLYAEVTKNDELQELANKIFDFFVKKEIMHVQYGNRVKLHMTLMKTSRLKGHQKKGEWQNTFNGSKILGKYKNYYFGKSQLKYLNICERGTEDKDGYYKTLTNINLYE